MTAFSLGYRDLDSARRFFEYALRLSRRGLRRARPASWIGRA